MVSFPFSAFVNTGAGYGGEPEGAWRNRKGNKILVLSLIDKIL